MSKHILRKFLSPLLFISALVLFISKTNAQGLTLQPAAPEVSLGGGFVSQNIVVIILIVLRILLVSALTIAGVYAFQKGWGWGFAGGNDKKAYESKEQLGMALIIITGIFILLALFRYVVPDYRTLAF